MARGRYNLCLVATRAAAASWPWPMEETCAPGAASQQLHISTLVFLKLSAAQSPLITHLPGPFFPNLTPGKLIFRRPPRGFQIKNLGRKSAISANKTGALGRNRTCDLSLHPTSAFTATSMSCVRGLDYAFAKVPGRTYRHEPSSLYTFPLRGLARRCHRLKLPRGFTEFGSIHTGAFATWCPKL